MANSNLMDDLAALVHHVELSKAGWRDRALELAIIAILFAAEDPLTDDALRQELNEQLPVPLARAQIQAVLRRLISKANLVKTPEGDYKLAEATLVELSETFDEAAALTNEVVDSFKSSFADVPGQIRPTWGEFESAFLLPLVSELGARTYELLSGSRQDFSTAASHVRYLDTFPRASRLQVSECIAAFLNPRDETVRSYVLGLLNSRFLVQSIGLSERAFASIVDSTSRQLKLAAFLDTNFLFSLIGLHENPADDVVDALNFLLPGMKGRADVRLYILPITYDEARRTIGSYEDRLRGIVLGRELARAAREGTGDLSGITLKYIRESLRANRRLSAEEYFRPYRENLLEVCRSKGVELYNADLDELRTDQGVIDDLNDQLKFQERTRERGAKPYQIILHDMVLWHFTKRRRATRVDSPLEARYWIATLDFGLLGFDAYKRRQSRDSLPVCIHPTVLLQVLQFWFPRSEELDIALMDSLRPLLPHEFDPAAEETTIRILRGLSRFEGAEDLGHETLKSVLVSDAVRARIEVSDEVEEEVAVIRDALIGETAAMRRRAGALKDRAEELEGILKERDRRIGEMSTRLAALEEERGEQLRAQEELAAERERSGRLQEELRELGDRLDAVQEQAAHRDRVAFVTRVVGAGVLLAGGVLVVVSPWLERILPLNRFTVDMLLSFTALGVLLLLSDVVAFRRHELRHWRVTQILHRVRGWICASIGALIVGMIASYLYDQLAGR